MANPDRSRRQAGEAKRFYLIFKTMSIVGS
jgi:hypothetical protein